MTRKKSWHENMSIEELDQCEFNCVISHVVHIMPANWWYIRFHWFDEMFNSHPILGCFYRKMAGKNSFTNSSGYVYYSRKSKGSPCAL
jgi:hypothetical protein